MRDSVSNFSYDFINENLVAVHKFHNTPIPRFITFFNYYGSNKSEMIMSHLTLHRVTNVEILDFFS